MSDQINQPKITKVFDRLMHGNSIKTMRILTVFLGIRGGIGLTEEELVNKSGLDKDDALSEISWLEMHSFVCYQEGTSDHSIHRYKLARGVELRLDISRPV